MHVSRQITAVVPLQCCVFHYQRRRREGFAMVFPRPKGLKKYINTKTGEERKKTRWSRDRFPSCIWVLIIAIAAVIVVGGVYLWLTILYNNEVQLPRRFHLKGLGSLLSPALGYAANNQNETPLAQSNVPIHRDGDTNDAANITLNSDGCTESKLKGNITKPSKDSAGTNCFGGHFGLGGRRLLAVGPAAQGDPPETMQKMMALQQQLSPLTRQQSTMDRAQTGEGMQGHMNLDLLMNMFGGIGGGGFTIPNTPDVLPEGLYANQLAQLQEMGFFSTQENIIELCATAGNVHAAVEWLLETPVSNPKL